MQVSFRMIETRKKKKILKHITQGLMGKKKKKCWPPTLGQGPCEEPVKEAGHFGHLPLAPLPAVAHCGSAGSLTLSILDCSHSFLLLFLLLSPSLALSLVLSSSSDLPPPVGCDVSLSPSLLPSCSNGSASFSRREQQCTPLLCYSSLLLLHDTAVLFCAHVFFPSFFQSTCVCWNIHGTKRKMKKLSR